MLTIPKIVITGGPCSGKTTALAAIVQFCKEHEFYPPYLGDFQEVTENKCFSNHALSLS